MKMAKLRLLILGVLAFFSVAAPSHNQEAALSSKLESIQGALADTKEEVRALYELAANPQGLPLGVPDLVETVLGSDEVAVRLSKLPGAGRGAFARRIFKSGDLVSNYKCEDVKKLNADIKASWNVNDTHLCDASAFPLHNPMLYVNSVSTLRTCLQQNLRMRRLPSGEIAYVAIKDIAVGEELLVDYGANYFRLASPRIASYECHLPPLSVLSCRGAVAGINRLLDENSTAVRYVSQKDGWTALMDAIANGQRGAVKALLARGALPLYGEDTHRNALYVACHHGFADLVELLIDSDSAGWSRRVVDTADVRGLVTAQAVVAGAQSGSLDVLEALLKFADPGDAASLVNLAIEGSGETPLLAASRRGHVYVVAALLKAGADYNQAASPAVGATPLFVAAEHRHVGVVEVLVRAGANVNSARVDTGSTPLFMASQKGNAEMVVALLLLGASADLGRQRSDGVTPLCMAANLGHAEAVLALLQGGAQIDGAVPGAAGVTPLFLASQNGHLEVVDALLRAGAAFRVARESDGATPLSVAVLNGHALVAESLRAEEKEAQRPGGNYL